MRHLLVLALACATPACAGPMTKLRGDNQRLAGSVDDLRAELRAERRKSRDLENQVALLKDKLAQGTPRPPADPPPPVLPVQVLSPDDVPEDGTLVGTADDGTEIVYTGDALRDPIDPPFDEQGEAMGGGSPAGSAGRAGGKAPRGIDGEDAAPPPAAPRPRAGQKAHPDLAALPTSTDLGVTERVAPVAAPKKSDPAAIELYKRGTSALKSREHVAAIAAFRDLVTRFPDDDLADNAQYWLGEAYYDQKDYPRAITEFRATVAHYPHGNKVPDALLKIGFSYLALGESEKARAALDQVVKQYPGSSPATIARARLEQP